MSASARILVVDDEEAHMHALCNTLGDHDFETKGFSNGYAALEEMRTSAFDLLLTDLMMPGLNGIELLRQALEIDPDIVGIIMTGEGTIATAVDAMKSGALDYILKPFKLSAILPVLSRALAVRRLRTENAALHRDLLERTQQLELANRELEAFAYSVSHDLRAPLRAIDSYSQILLEDYGKQLPEDGSRYLDNIIGNARRMSTLIEDILRFSQTSRHSLQRSDVEVRPIVDECLEEIRKDYPGSTVEVHYDDLPRANADRSLLRQVYLNLLSNAYKFTQRSEAPRIEIGAVQQKGETVYFVRDNGAGFDMAYAHKLFIAFNRLHSFDQFEGTGVGLSTVHRIIQRHGGRIWTEAKENEGAAFYFTLPAATA